VLCPGRGAFANVAEAKSKGCFAIINKEFVDFVCSNQSKIEEYNAEKKAKAYAQEGYHKRLDGIKDRLSKKGVLSPGRGAFANVAED
jgi:hypothetical protein